MEKLNPEKVNWKAASLINYWWHCQPGNVFRNMAWHGNSSAKYIWQCPPEFKILIL